MEDRIMYLIKPFCNKRNKYHFLLVSLFSVCTLLSCRFGLNSNINIPLTETPIETLTATMALSPTPLGTETLTATMTPLGTPTLGLKSIWRKSRIAFASNRDGNFQIYLMRPDGSEVTQLTHSKGENHSPAWSQD